MIIYHYKMDENKIITSGECTKLKGVRIGSTVCICCNYNHKQDDFTIKEIYCKKNGTLLSFHLYWEEGKWIDEIDYYNYTRRFISDDNISL